MNPGSPTTDRASRRAAVLDDPRMESLRNPRARRLLIGAMIALLAAEAVVFATMMVAPVLFVVLLAVLVVLWVFCLGALKASTRGVEELSPEQLDERQAKVRGEIYSSAYRIGFLLLTVELATAGLWLVLDWPSPSAGVLTAALVVTFHVGLILPTMVAAATKDV